MSYIRLVEVEWSTGTSYYVIGNEDIEVGGNVYRYGIVTRVTLQNAISLDNDLETASMRVTFNDPQGTIKALFDPAAASVEYKAKVTYKYYDGTTATTKKIMWVNRPMQPNPPDEFELECVGNYGSLDQDCMYTITVNETDVPDVDVVGQVIPTFGGKEFSKDFKLPAIPGTFDRGVPTTTGMMTAFYYDSVVSLNMYTRMVDDGVTTPDPNYVFDSAGTDKTAWFAASPAPYTFNNGEVGNTWYGTDSVVAAVEFVFPAGYDRSLIGHIQDIVDTWVDCERVDTGSATHTAFTATAKLLELQDETAAVSRVFYCFTKQRKGREILKMLCDSIGCHWRLSGDNKIELFFVHPLSMVVKKTFLADENGATEAIKSLTITNYDESKIVNDGETHSMFCDNTGKYLFKEAIQTIDGLQSQEKYHSVHRKDIFFPFLWYRWNGSEVWKDYTALNAAKWHRIMHRNPELMVNIEIDAQESISLMGGDIISCIHPHDVGDGAAYRFYMVQSMGEDSDVNNITFNMKDITDYSTVNTNCKSLIHARYPYYCLEGDKIIDEASGANVIATLNGGLLPTSDANGIWGGSFNIDGASQWITVTGLNETQARGSWDILQFTDFTISLSIQFNAIDVNQCIYSVRVSSTEVYAIIYNTASKRLNFILWDGTQKINIVPALNSLNDTNLHHVALCKVGSDFGLYQDGALIGHASYSGTDSIIGDIYWGRYSTAASPMKAKIQEMAIYQENIFNAAPDAGLTDTITPPANGFDCEGVIA